jgi:hypothetical protein
MEHTSVIDDGEILRVNLRPLFVSDSKLFGEFDHLVKGLLSIQLVLVLVFHKVIETDSGINDEWSRGRTQNLLYGKLKALGILTVYKTISVVDVPTTNPSQLPRSFPSRASTYTPRALHRSLSHQIAAATGAEPACKAPDHRIPIFKKSFSLKSIP